MGKKSISEEIEELKSDWKRVGDLFNSVLESAKKLVFNRDELNESDIPDLDEVLALTDNLKKKMNQMYDEHAGFREAFIKPTLVVLKRCASMDEKEEGSTTKKPHHSN